MARSSEILIAQDPILAKAEEAKKILQRITELLEENSSEKYRGTSSQPSSPVSSARPQTSERGKDRYEMRDT